MSDNVPPFPVVPRRPTPLKDEMLQLAFGFKLQTGQDATHIMLPRKALRSQVKPWVDALCAEEPEIGKPYQVFGRIVEMPDGEPACAFADLVVVMYDGERVIVGRADGF